MNENGNNHNNMAAYRGLLARIRLRFFACRGSMETVNHLCGDAATEGDSVHKAHIQNTKIKVVVSLLVHKSV